MSSILGVDWPGRGEGRGFSLGLGARDLPTGHSSRLRLWFRLSLRDSGDLHPGACLTSGAHRTPKPGGSRAPFRVSSAPLARPVGWPAVPYPSPPGQAPARRSQARLSLFLAETAARSCGFLTLRRGWRFLLCAGWGSDLGMLGYRVQAVCSAHCESANSRARFQY